MEIYLMVRLECIFRAWQYQHYEGLLKIENVQQVFKVEKTDKKSGDKELESLSGWKVLGNVP